MLEGPVTVAYAVQAGITYKQLRGPRWRRVRRGIYVSTGLSEDPALELEAITRSLPPCALFSGVTAAWLHGLDIGPGRPIEVTIPFDIGISGRAALRLRRVVRPPEAVVIHGFRATTVDRTLVDSARSLPLPRLVALLDEAMHRGLTNLDRLEQAAAENAGRPGVGRFRRSVELSDGEAESPMESELRVLLMQAGLPRPVGQAELRGPTGLFLGRVDLYYPDARLAIEYDGDIHRTQLNADNRRQNLILGAGFGLLRFTRSDLREHPSSVITQVQAAHRQGLAKLRLPANRPPTSKRRGRLPAIDAIAARI